MRVKAGPRAKEGWFAAGEYVVLGMTIKPSGQIQFIVEESEATPGLFEPGVVTITDGRLPPSWRAAIDADGNLDLEPEEWTVEFWDAYENGDPAAWEIYRIVKRRIEAESR